MAHPVLYLIGTSGHPNFGDEFITASWLRYLAEAAPEAEVWLDCPQPGSASTLFHGLHPRLNVTNTLWRAVLDSSHLPFGEIGARVRELVTNLGSPAYDLGLLKLREAGSLHLIGGGYLNGVWPHHAAITDGMRAVKDITGARLFATGHGLMPVITGGADPRAVFKNFNYVSVRDSSSAETYNVSQGIDDAFLGAQDEIARNTPEAKGLFVCIQNDMTDAETFEKAVTAVRPIIERAISDGKQVSYVEAIPGVDYAAFALLSDLIPADRFIPFSHIWQHGLPLGPDQEWVTTRYHFHLLASAAGARGIAVGLKPGDTDVQHQSLIDLGSGWTYAGVDEIGPGLEARSSEGTLSRTLLGLAIRKRTEAGRLYPVTPGPGQGKGESSRTVGGLLRQRLGSPRRR